MNQKPIIALLYDFDKTLCTTDMEDYSFIPSLGYTPAQFWQKANNFGWENQMDGLLAQAGRQLHQQDPVCVPHPQGRAGGQRG